MKLLLLLLTCLDSTRTETIRINNQFGTFFETGKNIFITSDIVETTMHVGVESPIMELVKQRDLENCFWTDTSNVNQMISRYNNFLENANKVLWNQIVDFEAS